jgi:hyperosmotically inducible protein
MSVKQTTFTTASLLLVLSFSLGVLSPACTGAGGSPSPAPKGQVARTVDLKPQDSPKEPTATLLPSSDPKAVAPKTLESKTQPIPSPKPTEQQAKSPEPGDKTVKSMILTVKLALMADPRLFPYELDVEVKDQKAVLSGEVASEEEKTAATLIALRVDGIKTVVNKLKINRELAQALSRKQDERISQQIKERFKKSKTLDSAGFEVKTQNGVVALSGSTRYQVIILEAAEVARQVPGVRAVHTGSVRLEPAG